MKQKANKGRNKAEKWKKDDKVILSTKYLVFKEKPVKKLVNWYISPYIIEEMIFTNIVKLRLLTVEHGSLHQAYYDNMLEPLP